MTPHRILIVDDQRDVRRMLHAAIESLGADFKVVDVPSGEEAMLIIYRSPVDLLITDVRLPGISGLELKERARGYNPNLKLIMITGLTDPRVRRQIEEAQVDGVFFKPIEIPEFLESVQRSLGLRSQAAPTLHPTSGEEEAIEQSLGDYISWLRQDLKATAVVLIDDNGRVLEQAGGLEQISGNPSLLSALMVSFSASSKVSQVLGTDKLQDVFYFNGLQTDLYMTHVGSAAALLLALRSNTEPGRVGKIIEALRPAGRELLGALNRMKEGLIQELPVEVVLPRAPVAVEVEEDSGEISPELDLLFNQVEANQFRAQNVNDFWDNLATQEDSQTVINPDALTYEQARKLGLAPSGKD